MNSHQSFPNEVNSAPRARRFVEHSLPGVPREVLDSVAVMVSELATNVVLHAGTSFEVDVDYKERDGHIRIEVSDLGSGIPVRKGPTTSETRGRGLQIVEALSNNWGIVWGDDNAAKTVWFEMDVPGVGSPSRQSV